MIAISSIDLYNLLRPKLGDQEARVLTEYISAVGEENAAKQTEAFEKIINKDIDVLRSELRADISELRGEMRAEIAQSKSDMIKWMFGFFITLALMMVGLYLK